LISDDFEVAIFLTPQTSPHSILSKQKQFTEKEPLKSNSNKLTSWLTTGNADIPIDVDEENPIVVQEDDDNVDVGAIPEAPKPSGDLNKSLFVQSSSEDEDEEFFQTQKTPARRRQGKQQQEVPIEVDDEDDSDEAEEEDDKKKLGLQTQYDGFSIYGKTLCLIVKRRGVTAPKDNGPSTSQAMMENWVSTQVNMLGVEDD
jgi:hypothetical protein